MTHLSCHQRPDISGPRNTFKVTPPTANSGTSGKTVSDLQILSNPTQHADEDGCLGSAGFDGSGDRASATGPDDFGSMAIAAVAASHANSLDEIQHQHHLSKDYCRDEIRDLPSVITSTSIPSPSSPKHAPHAVMQRKIWVKRPGASSTRVEVSDDDLVDNVRDAILLKYANSLGRNIDSPDITLKIVAREQANKNVPNERALGPEESISRTLDAYYPGGQTIDEALIIEVPSRRTPRPSPRPGNHAVNYFYPDVYRPDDTASDYFQTGPVQSPRISYLPHPNQHAHSSAAAGPHHSLAVLNSGQIPVLPSPGGHGSSRNARYQRPKYPRQQTSSPTIIHSTQASTNLQEPKPHLNGTTSSATLPTSPGPSTIEHKPSITPPNRPTSPHSEKRKGKKFERGHRGPSGDNPPPPSQPASASLLDGSVPPINVLIVEDNPINLKLLEQFMRRLKVRWKTAMNGREAVNTWKTGGFHLVMMDIQLPIMNGLDATREIRRLEAVNNIGVFSGSPLDGGQKMTPCSNENPSGEDALPDRSLFKSPVIIVALTASSLQSDRHEALAAGCNDFLTKPVNFMWMERKVTEWGCMQALIDYDGWRKWKEYGKPKKDEDPAKKAQEEKEAKAKARAELRAAFARPPPGSSASTAAKSSSTTSTGSGNTSTSTPTKETPTKSNNTSGNNKDTSTTEDRPSTTTSTPLNKTSPKIKPAATPPSTNAKKDNLAASNPTPGNALSQTMSNPSPVGNGSVIANGIQKRQSTWTAGSASSAVTTSSPLAAPPLRSQKTQRSGSNTVTYSQLGTTPEVDETP